MSKEALGNVATSLLSAAERPDLSQAANQADKRSFYIVEYKAFSKPSGIRLMNEKEVFGDGWPQFFKPPGLFDRGFRTYPAVPRYRVSKKLGRPPQDIERHGFYWFVSDGAKQVLSGLSKMDFQFMALDIETDAGQEPVRRWLCDILSILDPVDEDNSAIVIVQGDSGEPIYRLRSDIILSMKEDAVGEHRAFRLLKSFDTIVCDDIFRSALRDAGITGLRFQDVNPL